jgi:adenosylcobinamide amidohydrolase
MNASSSLKVWACLAVVIACTGAGSPLPYAGTATPVGYLIGRTVRAALANQL